MTTTTLFTPLTLPCGAVLTNRIAKSAMEENLADAEQAPSDALIHLYRRWAEGGAGLLITGNVMIDPRAMTGPGAVVLTTDAQAAHFRAWAAAAQAQGAQAWMQLNHPGRQMPAALQQTTWAPSAVALDLGGFSGQFRPPQAMGEAEIEQVKTRFIRSAQLAEQLGFNGVQIHAAHGYLLSQFLSPLTNQRQDRWGGALANRARLLLEIVQGVRTAVAPGFALSVKLNSADFQRGGFALEDARQVIEWLNPLGVDLLELSGGSYEAPAMHGQARDGRTLAREAYFLEFARDIVSAATMPVMVTGGIRRRAVAEQVLASGVAVAGIATALALAPDLPRQWQGGQEPAPQLRPIPYSNKVLASAAYMAMVRQQLLHLSRGQPPRPKAGPTGALLAQQLDTWLRGRQYRRWVRAQ